MTPEQTAEQVLEALTNLQSRVTLVEELLKAQRTPVYVVNQVEQATPELMDKMSKLGQPGVSRTPLKVVYYDVALNPWVPIRLAEDYPYKTQYLPGQEILENDGTWVVINSWILGGIYRVLISRTIPLWMSRELWAISRTKNQG